MREFKVHPLNSRDKRKRKKEIQSKESSSFISFSEILKNHLVRFLLRVATMSIAYAVRLREQNHEEHKYPRQVSRGIITRVSTHTRQREGERTNRVVARVLPMYSNSGIRKGHALRPRYETRWGFILLPNYSARPPITRPQCWPG